MSEKIVVTLREISERFGIGIEGARAKAKRRAAKGAWRILPQNHPADPLRVELPPNEWVMGSQQEAYVGPNVLLPTLAPLQDTQQREPYDIKTLVELLDKLTEQSVSTTDRLITAEREKGEAELRAAVAIAGRETAEKRLADVSAELEAVRERLAAADRRHREAEERHADETQEAKAKLEAWKAQPWWKRLAS